MLDTPFRTAAGWAFFSAVFIFALVPGSLLDRLYNGLLTFGAVGLAVLTVIALASLKERIEDAITGGDDDDQPYELDIEIYDGAKWRRIRTHLDEWQIYRLFRVMAEEDHSVYAETRKEWGTKAFTRWDLSRVLPMLEREGIAHQVGGRKEWRLTDYGLRIYQRMQAPPDNERHGSVKVRI